MRENIISFTNDYSTCIFEPETVSSASIGYVQTKLTIM